MTASAHPLHPTAESWLRGAASHLRLARLGATNASILRVQVLAHAKQATEHALRAVLCAHHRDFTTAEKALDLRHRLRTTAISVPEEIIQFGEATFEPAAEFELSPRIEEKRLRDALRVSDAAVNWAQQVVTQAENRECR